MCIDHHKLSGPIVLEEESFVLDDRSEAPDRFTISLPNELLGAHLEITRQSGQTHVRVRKAVLDLK